MGAPYFEALGVRMRAFQAASMYTGVAARMTEMLQSAAAPVLPEFVAAMELI